MPYAFLLFEITKDIFIGKFFFSEFFIIEFKLEPEPDIKWQYLFFYQLIFPCVDNLFLPLEINPRT